MTIFAGILQEVYRGHVGGSYLSVFVFSHGVRYVLILPKCGVAGQKTPS